MNVKKWIRKVEEQIKYLEELEPTDRLSFMSGIAFCTNAIVGSVSGWEAWLSSPTLMENFREEELREIFNEFRRVTIGFLKYDIEWSKKISLRLQDPASSSSERTKYIS